MATAPSSDVPTVLILDYIDTPYSTQVLSAECVDGPKGKVYLVHLRYHDVNSVGSFVQKFKPGFITVDVTNPWSIDYGGLSWETTLLCNNLIPAESANDFPTRIVQATQFQEMLGPKVRVIDMRSAINALVTAPNARALALALPFAQKGDYDDLFLSVIQEHYIGYRLFASVPSSESAVAAANPPSENKPAAPAANLTTPENKPAPPVQSNLGDSLVPQSVATPTRLGLLFCEATSSGPSGQEEHGRVLFVWAPRTEALLASTLAGMRATLPSGAPILLIGGPLLAVKAPVGTHVVLFRVFTETCGDLQSMGLVPYNIDADEPLLKDVRQLAQALGASVEAFSESELSRHLCQTLAAGRPPFQRAPITGGGTAARPDNVPSLAGSLVVPALTTASLGASVSGAMVSTAQIAQSTVVPPATTPTIQAPPAVTTVIQVPSETVAPPAAAAPAITTTTVQVPLEAVTPAVTSTAVQSDDIPCQRTVNYPGGQIKKVYPYKDGVRHGCCMRYYLNGHLRDMRNYDKGTLHGPFIQNDEGGRQRTMGQFFRGMRQGEWKIENVAITYVNGVDQRR